MPQSPTKLSGVKFVKATRLNQHNNATSHNTNRQKGAESHRTGARSSPNQPSPKKLSHKKLNHKTYRHNETLITKALCEKISKRRIDIKARDICKTAGLTSPTFYYHYRNIHDALTSYELKLKHELYYKLPERPKKRAFFLILVSFVEKNRTYFLAVAKGDDHRLLKEIIFYYRKDLVNQSTNDRNFSAYTSVIIAIINYWLKQETQDAETTDFYSRKLASIRPIRW